jgi:hypothetical protein
MSTTLQLVEGQKDKKEFIHYPWDLYKNDPHWVPPLKLSVQALLDPKHPFYKKADVNFYLARRDGKIVGRIASIVNHSHNSFHEEAVGFFGFFEVENNLETARLLIDQAKKDLAKLGLTKIIGPMNPSTNYEAGLLVDGFDDPPQIMMTYNPPYYQILLEQLGFTKAKDLLAYFSTTTFQMPEKIRKVAERSLSNQSVVMRPVNLKKWKDEVELMLEVYNDAWEKNWGFVPMSENEFRHMASEMKQIVNPNMIQMCFVDGKIAGFAVCLLDYNQVFKRIPSGTLFSYGLPLGLLKLLRAKKYIDRCRVVTLGLKEKYRKSGLASIMYLNLYDEANRIKLKTSEMSWILEDNLLMRKPMEVMGAKVYKTYRIYEQNLS